MNKIALIQTFCKVAQYCNFTGAAKSLNISAAAVSKQIKHLEQELGVALFLRTTRKVTLTSVGAAYYQEVQSVLLALEHACGVISTSKIEPSGVIRVQSSRFFAEKIILPRMPAFQDKYPKVILDLQIAEEIPHLFEESLDVVFGMSLSVASNSVQKKISTTRYVFCASPEYVQKQGLPASIFDLKNHRYLTHGMRKPSDCWVFEGDVTVSLNPTLYVNDAEALTDCACRSMGIAALHHYQVAEALQQGLLVDVLPEVPMPAIPLFLYFNPAKFMQPKVKLWIDAMVSGLPAFM